MDFNGNIIESSFGALQIAVRLCIGYIVLSPSACGM